MAYPTLQAQGAITAAAATALTAVPVLPAHQLDDILIVCAVNWAPVTVGDVAAMTISAGWTLVLSNTNANVGSIDGLCMTWWKRAVGSAETNPTVTRTGDTGTDTGFQTRAYVIRGCITTGNPWEYTAASPTSLLHTTANQQMYAMQVTGLERLVVHFMLSMDNQAAGAAPSGWTAGTAAVSATGTDVGFQTFWTNKDTSNVASANSFVAAPVQGGYCFHGITFIPPTPPPTVVLNTPADASSVSDTTPTLEFTGTSTDSNDIRYEVQVATANSFAPIDSYSEVNFNGSVALNIAGNTAVGQSFTGNGDTLGFVKFYLDSYTPPLTGGILIASIYAHSGTFGTSSLPTGAALATSDAVSLSTVPNISPALIAFPFTGVNQIALTNGTNYVVAIALSGISGNHFEVRIDNSPTASGNKSTLNNVGSWVLDTVNDLIFYVYNNTIILDKLSGTDAGFVNTVNGADTDPFTSSQKVSYTVQTGDALASGTYYWRVHGLDPTGSNTYGPWSETRSFTVAAAVAGLANQYWGVKV